MPPPLPPGIGIAEARRIQIGWAPPNEAGSNNARDQGQFQKLKPGYYPGDLGWDPLNIKPQDPTKLREMQTKELQNGRLGMIAAAGFLAQEAVTGATWSAGDAATEKLVLGAEIAVRAADLAQ